jgi:hypothetical protein
MVNTKFKDCFVVFLDILGVKNLLEKIEEDEKLARNIIDSLNINTKFRANKETSRHGNLLLRSFYFSDSFAFIMEKEQRSLPHLLLIIRFLQDRFWKKGFCFRGSVTIGKMYWPKRSENILLGEGIKKAYSLESEVAIYPRIIISDDLFKFIENENIDGSPFTKEGKKLKDVIIKDKDGIYFLDLLNKNILRIKGEKIVQNNDNTSFHITCNAGNESTFKEILKSVEKIINENLNISNEKIKQKYEWLKSYLEEKRSVNE